MVIVCCWQFKRQFYCTLLNIYCAKLSLNNNWKNVTTIIIIDNYYSLNYYCHCCCWKRLLLLFIFITVVSMADQTDDKRQTRQSKNPDVIIPVKAPSSISDLAQLISKSNSEIKSSINQLNSKLTQSNANLSEQINNIRVNISNDISKLAGRLDAKIDGCIDECRRGLSANGTEINKQAENIGVLDNRIVALEYQSVQCDIILNGIPFVQNEILSELFAKLCDVINYNHSVQAVAAIFRVNKKPNSSAVSTIIVKFTTLFLKKEFLRQFYSRKELKLSLIGFDSELRIFANESLTKNSLTIHQYAKNQLKRRLLAKVFTRGGRIFILPVGHRKDEIPIMVTSICQIDAVLK